MSRDVIRFLRVRALEVHLRLYGIYRSAARSDDISVDLPAGDATVRTAISELLSRPNLCELKKLMLDAESVDPRPSTLILVSGREIGALAGLETMLKEDDEVSLLPIAHGG
jgi:molybdopterin converting factor small subunit